MIGGERERERKRERIEEEEVCDVGSQWDVSSELWWSLDVLLPGVGLSSLHQPGPWNILRSR